ncbi:MAG: hypothetical protein QM658_10715 [Gordonia sp. (in: high G+C Gram-positive bacteria)]
MISAAGGASGAQDGHVDVGVLGVDLDGAGDFVGTQWVRSAVVGHLGVVGVGETAARGDGG